MSVLCLHDTYVKQPSVNPSIFSTCFILLRITGEPEPIPAVIRYTLDKSPIHHRANTGSRRKVNKAAQIQNEVSLESIYNMYVFGLWEEAREPK